MAVTKESMLTEQAVLITELKEFSATVDPTLMTSEEVIAMARGLSDNASMYALLQERIDGWVE